MATCTTEGCPGHLWKFSDCVAEAVYEWSLDGSAVEQTGDVEFEGHFSLFIVPEDEPTRIDPGGDNRPVTVPAGWYILYCADSGAVDLWSYDTERDARTEFELHDLAYSNWGDEEI